MAASVAVALENPLSAPPRWQSLACWSLLAACFLLLYAGTLRGLASDWWNDPDYSHGIVVPFVAAAIVFRRRREISRIKMQPKVRAALAVIVASQLIYLAGYFGAEFFLQRSSVVICLCGMILLFLGWEFLRQLALPLLLLELCIPLPAVLMNQITQPLQLMASAGSEAVIRLCGIPVYRSGNLLVMAHQTLNVSEACSGIRSLVSLVTLAVIMVSFIRVPWIVRALFVASAAGVAIIANALRVSGVGVLGHYLGTRFTVGFWHLLEGWSVFIVAFVLLSLELKLIGRFFAVGARA